MVSNIIGDSVGQAVNIPVRLIRNHEANPQAIKDLIKGSLQPLHTDPIPTRIVLNDIVVTKDREGRLALTCNVLYECPA